MAGVRLVSGGDSLIVWDGYDPVFTYRPVTGAKRILNHSWNLDGSCIASALEGSDKICLTHVKSSSINCLEMSTSINCNPVRVQYPKTSLNNLIVGASDKVFLYDVGKQKAKKEFKLPSDASLTCLTTNFNDHYIAVGATGGQIILLGCVSFQIGTPMRSSKLQTVTSVKYSNIRNSMLASSGESGHVALWDCNTNKMMHLFAEHKAPATGLAFSHVNEVLFLSSGLDKRCVCYDTQTKRMASTIKTDHALTSVDFCSDGITLALGTTTGKILVYDLRSFKAPAKVLSGHTGPVKSVQYQPPAIDRQGFGSVAKSSSKLSTQVSKKNLASMMKENLPAISENIAQTSAVESFSSLQGNITSGPFLSSSASDRKDSLSSQIFSPIRDVDEVFHSPVIANSFLSVSRFSHDSLFSPLREASGNAGNISISGTPTVFETKDSISGSPKLKSPKVNFDRDLKSGPASAPVYHGLEAEIDRHVPVGRNLSADNDRHVPVGRNLSAENDRHVTVGRNLSAENDRHVTVDRELSAENDRHVTVDRELSAKNDRHVTVDRDLSAKNDGHVPDLSLQNNNSPSVLADLGFRGQNEKPSSRSFQSQNGNHVQTDRGFQGQYKDHVPTDRGFQGQNANPEAKKPEAKSFVPNQRSPPFQSDIDSGLFHVEEKSFENEPKKQRKNFDEAKPPHDDKSISTIEALLIAFPEAMNNNDPSGDAVRVQGQAQESQQNGRNFSAPTAATFASPFQGLTGQQEDSRQFRDEYFVGLVRDGMEDFCFEMRRHLWHIHYDIIRSFDRQRIEIEHQLHRQALDNEELAIEVARLREENDRLKSSPFIFNQQ